MFRYMMLYSSFSAWISHFLACMGGCFGCCSKSQPIIAVDEPSKGLRIQGKLVRKPSISDDFWSTSTCDMEISTVQSHRSMSSISISNQSLSQSSGTGNASNNNEFVNHGYLLWNQTRLQWLASKNPENRRVAEEPMLNFDPWKQPLAEMEVGMFPMKAYSGLANVSLSQFLSRTWSTFLLIFGSTRVCTINHAVYSFQKYRDWQRMQESLETKDFN